jgi:hypothetical protein
MTRLLPDVVIPSNVGRIGEVDGAEMSMSPPGVVGRQNRAPSLPVPAVNTNVGAVAAGQLVISGAAVQLSSPLPPISWSFPPPPSRLTMPLPPLRNWRSVAGQNIVQRVTGAVFMAPVPVKTRFSTSLPASV